MLSILAAEAMGTKEVKIKEKWYRWGNNRLYIRASHGYLEVPPVAKRWILIENLHEHHMHIGSEKLYQALSKEYYWEFMFEDCFQFVKRCLACQL